MTLRIRCEVLRMLAIVGPTDSKALSERLPDLTPEQIQKAIYRLFDQDRIKKVGQKSRESNRGRPLFVYEAREEYEPPSKAKNIENKAGRQNYKQSLRAAGGKGVLSPVIRFRDRKVRLLRKLINHTHGNEKDLLFGILADYGEKPGREVSG